jgi:SulP family sulfate permease
VRRFKIPGQWLPESVRCLRAYSRHNFGADLLAGFTVGLVALALAMAFGIEVGMVLAALLYIYRISQTTTVAPVTEEYIRDGSPHVLQDKQLPWYVAILRIHGPFLFGTTEKLAKRRPTSARFPPW